MNWLALLLQRFSPPATPPIYSETRTRYYDLPDRVDLGRHARTAGLNNLPHRDAVIPTDVEVAVVHEFENRHRASLETARGDVRAIAEEFAKIEDELPTSHTLEAVPSEAAATVERMLAADHLLEHARRSLQERVRIERGFRRRHGLEREPRYPESRVLHLATVGVVVLVESVMNVGFYAHLSAFGLVGAGVLSVGVSSVNAASGVVSGFLAVRNLAHPRAAVRSLALTCSVLAVAAIGVFNLAVAHLRDLASPSAAGTVLWVTLARPFSLTALSFGLFVLGLVAAAIAIWHGRTLDDACPGFAEVVRARRQAAEDFKAANELLRGRALTVVEAVPGRCAATMQKARELVERLRDLTVRAERRFQRYESERAHYEHWTRVLLLRFRGENEAVRTAPSPSYFREFPTLPPQLEGDVVAELTSRLEAARAALDALADTSHAITLQQPARVAAVHRLLDAHVRLAVRRADAGRGDGSDAFDPEGAADDRRWVS